MSSNMRALRLAAGALIVSAGLIVAGCANGSVSSAPAATATVAPGTQAIPNAGGSLTVAASGSQVASLTFGAGAPAGVTITASSSALAPPSAPTISSLKRAPQSITGAVPFFYVTFSVSANISSAYFASESVTLTANQPANASYGAAFDDITSMPATELGVAGPGTVADGVVTIANNSTASAPLLLAGHTYLIQFFYVPAGTNVNPTPTATPTGGPSTGPTATPSPGPSGPATIPNYVFNNQTTNTEDSINCMPTASCASTPLFGGNLSIAFGTPSVSIPISLYTVTSTASISPSGFPALANAVVYLEVVSQSDVGGSGFQAGTLQASTATFAQTPGVLISNVTGATGCAFWGYVSGNNGYVWTQISPTSGSAAVSGGSATMPGVTLASGAVTISPTPFYGAVVCQ